MDMEFKDISGVTTKELLEHKAYMEKHTNKEDYSDMGILQSLGMLTARLGDDLEKGVHLCKMERGLMFFALRNFVSRVSLDIIDKELFKRNWSEVNTDENTETNNQEGTHGN